MIVLDSNIIILYLNGDSKIIAWINRQTRLGEKFAVSTVTVVEILTYDKMTIEAAILTENLLKRLLIVDVDISIAREAARLRRNIKMGLADGIIAATATTLRVPIASRDAIFKKLKDALVIVP